MMDGYQRQQGFDPAPVNMVDAQRASAQTLSLLGQAQQMIYNRAVHARTQQGAIEGADAQTDAQGRPILRKPGTAYGAAFNEAALNTYGSALMVDIDNKLLEYRLEAGSDPDKFQQLVKGYSEGVLAEVPVQLKGPTRNYIGKESGRVRNALHEARFAQEREAATTQVLTTLSHLEDRTARAAHDGDLEGLAELTPARAAHLDAAVASGLISEADRTRLEFESDQRLEETLVVGGFQLAYDAGAGVSYIREFFETPPEGMSPERAEALGGRMLEQLRRRTAVEDKVAAEDTAQREARHRAGERTLTIAMLDGELSPEMLRDYLAADMIAPSMARTLETESYRQGPPQDDMARVAWYEVDRLGTEEWTILTDQNLTWPTRSRLIQERRALVEDNSAFANRQSFREANRRIEGELGIQTGMVMPWERPDIIQRVSRAKTLMYDRVDEIVREKGRVTDSDIFAIEAEVVGTIRQQQQQNALQAEQEALARAERELVEATGADRRILENQIERHRTRIEQMRGAQ